MIFGFTGTQSGMSDLQKRRVTKLLQASFIEAVHHGDCIGADSDFHKIASLFELNIVMHPPINSSKRAFCGGNVLASKEYLERNNDIVAACDVLIAAPKTEKEELRSGTWATIRYARKLGKRVIIV